MGMFASEYKMPIPAYARRIGVVTAPTGAAIPRYYEHFTDEGILLYNLFCTRHLCKEKAAKESIVKGIRMLDAG